MKLSALPGWAEFVRGASLAAFFGYIWFRHDGNLVAGLAGIFFGLVPAARGIRRMLAYGSLLRRRRKEAPKLRLDRAEVRILRAARRHGGTISVPIAVYDTGCTVEEAEAVLDRLASRGYALMQVSPNGRVRYRVPELEPPGG